MKYTKIHAAKETDIFQHLTKLYDLVLELKATCVLELGVRGGESTIALLEGVHVSNGSLLSIDISPCTEARAIIESYGLGSRWTFRQGDDLEAGLYMLHLIQMFDLIFIDTSHEYEHTVKEIQLFRNLLRSGGAMVFHDTATCPGVLKAIQENLADWPSEFRMNNNGLGILRKP